MMTVKNVDELKRKLSTLNHRKQFEIGNVDLIRMMDYNGHRRYFTLVSHVFDPDRTQFGFYRFKVSEKPYEQSNIKVCFLYQQYKGVTLIDEGE